VTDAARIQGEPTVTPLRPSEERAPPAASPLAEKLQHECEAMLRYALDRGKDIGPDLARRAGQVLTASAGVDETGRLADLTLLHSELATLIAPASGRTLVLLEQEHKLHPFLYVFGPVRLVRHMLGFAVFALLTTCLLSTFSTVDVEHVAQGWFTLNGASAFWVLAFLLSAAALGAAFSNLSTISHYIEHANYDPTFEGSYWARVVLGLISGVVLGEILFDLVIRNAADTTGLAPAGERIVLAFLGGFATAPVQRLLSNLSDAIGTLLHGRPATAPRPPAAAAPRSSDQG